MSFLILANNSYPQIKAYHAIQTYTLAFHVKWKGWILISLHSWHCCCCLPACLSEAGGILHGSFFNVLCKSCGEITQARSPPFVTDGKPFQRDYDALDLLSFSFLLKPRYQLSVSRALDCLDRGAHVSAHPSPESGWNSPLWPLCLCHSQLSGNTMTRWRHLKCTLIVPCWALLPLSPLPKKRLYSVPHSQLHLKMGLTFKYTSEMIQLEGKLMDCSIIGDVVDFSFIEIWCTDGKGWF